jgi:hypothetical protein
MEPPDDLHEPLFETFGVKPVTTDGSTPCWFLLRGYSFGSSTSDMLLLAIKRHVQQVNDPNKDILSVVVIRLLFKSVVLCRSRPLFCLLLLQIVLLHALSS